MNGGLRATQWALAGRLGWLLNAEKGALQCIIQEQAIGEDQTSVDNEKEKRNPCEISLIFQVPKSIYIQ